MTDGSKKAVAVSRTPYALGLSAVLAAVLAFALSLSVVKWPGIPGSVSAWRRLTGSAWR